MENAAASPASSEPEVSEFLSFFLYRDLFFVPISSLSCSSTGNKDSIGVKYACCSSVERSTGGE